MAVTIIFAVFDIRPSIYHLIRWFSSSSFRLISCHHQFYQHERASSNSFDFQFPLCPCTPAIPVVATVSLKLPPFGPSRSRHINFSTHRWPIWQLKSELSKRASHSKPKQLHQLLIAEELAVCKPSQLLRKMRQLLGDNRLEEGILRQLFLQRLPASAQIILIPTTDTVPLDDLAVLADRINTLWKLLLHNPPLS